jgi:hypothetical protein
MLQYVLLRWEEQVARVAKVCTLAMSGKSCLVSIVTRAQVTQKGNFGPLRRQGRSCVQSSCNCHETWVLVPTWTASPYALPVREWGSRLAPLEPSGDLGAGESEKWEASVCYKVPRFRPLVLLMRLVWMWGRYPMYPYKTIYFIFPAKNLTEDTQRNYEIHSLLLTMYR